MNENLNINFKICRWLCKHLISVSLSIGCAHKYILTSKAISNQNILHQVVLKLALGSRDHTSPGNSKGQKEFEHIVKDFNPAEKGETSEEAHCASNKTQLCLSCHLHEFILAFVMPPMRCNA